MNRRQKIIISITGIIIVTLILLGLTYGYFITQISGNTNSKSISVNTSNLKLVYDDGTAQIDVKNIKPGTEVGTKYFTVANEGNVDVFYGVVFENTVNGLTYQEDLVYTLECTSYLTNNFALSSSGSVSGTQSGTCSGVSATQFPSTSSKALALGNQIAPNITHLYKIVVTYKESGKDQSADMGKTFSTKINIDSVDSYLTDTSSLAFNVINNAMQGLNGTTVGSNVKTFTGPSSSTEKVLNFTEDDYGTSYYFRGNVNNNYVSFAGNLWRIVRINGDGSVRLILNEPDFVKNTGTYIRGGNGSSGGIYSSSSIKTEVDTWYLENISSTYRNYLSDSIFCNDLKYEIVDENASDSCISYYGESNCKKKHIYAAYNRLGSSVSTPTLMCDKNNSNNSSRYTVTSGETKKGVSTNGSLDYPIALLTADEATLGGAFIGQNSSSTYLSTVKKWFTMTPNMYSFVSNWNDVSMYIYSQSLSLLPASSSIESGSATIRPVINLKPQVKLTSGNGTLSKPYIVSL